MCSAIYTACLNKSATFVKNKDILMILVTEISYQSNDESDLYKNNYLPSTYVVRTSLLIIYSVFIVYLFYGL